MHKLDSSSEVTDMANRVLWINPVGFNDFDQPIKDVLEQAKRPNTTVDVVSLKKGPLHLEYHYYEALVLTDILHQIKQAEYDGYDAAVIGCFYDPGLREAREITEKLVVTAPAEACLHIAASLGHRFSIIVAEKKCVPKMHENAVNYGFEDRLASFKSIDMRVHDFQKNQTETANRMKAAAKEAIENDLAEVIILGCTIQFGFFKELQREIGVPVIDAVLGSFKYAEFLIELKNRFNWSQSKVYGYESPPEEEIIDWKLESQYGILGLWGQKRCGV